MLLFFEKEALPRLPSLVPPPRLRDILPAMWNEPYLETCCRSALHRLMLCDDAGRPPGLKDGRCLERLAGMGLAHERTDGRFDVTPEGAARHDSEIMKAA